ncbi:MAG: PHP domain-containing protein [Microbacteriaceae bacterium]|nr:PHP domain-containing protein [Microbacteriaceae bacterium]
MSALKFASHIHTNWSDDSSWSLARITRTLSRVGYDGALVCDHDRTMTDARWRDLLSECATITATTGFLLVPGIEYQDPNHIVHVPVFGDVPFYGPSPVISELLATASAAGAATLFAHPGRRAASEEFDSGWAAWLTGIEVWSRKYDGLHPNAWALGASERFGIDPFVSLDFHGQRQLYPLAMSIDLPANCTPVDVAHALFEGRARATAFGMDPRRFGSGVLGAIGMALETTRKRVAPRVRDFERVVQLWKGS